MYSITLILMHLSLVVMFVSAIAGVVLFIYRDILVENHKVLDLKAGAIWMPLNAFRIVFFWPLVFGNVLATRQEKQKLLLLVAGEEKGSDAE